MTNIESGPGESDPARRMPPLPDRDHLRGRRILVIEDVRIIADYLADLLQDFGCTVVGPFPDLAHARSAIAHETIDGAVLDQQLSAETSTSLASILREKGVPFLYVTGFAAEFQDPRFPPAPILEKPFTPRELHDAVLRMLG